MVMAYRSGFYNYPEPNLGFKSPLDPLQTDRANYNSPNVLYQNKRPSNPALRGRLLGISAALYCQLLQAQKKYHADDDDGSIPELENYEPRYDPTVIPISIEFDGETALAPGPPLVRAQEETYTSISKYHDLFMSGELTPTAVVQALLPLIRRDLSPPGEYSVAFLESRVDLVVKASEASTQRYKDKKPLGMLDGIPVAIKDDFDVQGYKTRLGSTIDLTPDNVPGASYSSFCVLKWEEAGAINVGKLTMHEFGLDTSNNNPHWGTPLNPFNEKYYTGGSSGGSAYAVSTGLLPVALGSDGGGSGRIPASFCGAYGLKPSIGRISESPSLNYSNTNACVSPIAASISDLEIAYRILATPDPNNAISSRFPAPGMNFFAGIRQKILGVERSWFNRADESVRNLCDDALAHYQSDGYKIVDISIPYVAEGQIAHALTILTDAAAAVDNSVLAQLTGANKILISLGRVTVRHYPGYNILITPSKLRYLIIDQPAMDYLRAQKLRNLLLQHLAALFQQYPGLVLVLPTTPCAGWHIDGGKTDLKYGVSDGDKSMRTMENIWMANFTGIPALSIPVGYVQPVEGNGDIPVGLMGMSEWGSEDNLIEWARDGEAFIEKGTDHGRQRPKIWVDVLELARQHMSSSNS